MEAQSETTDTAGSLVPTELQAYGRSGGAQQRCHLLIINEGRPLCGTVVDEVLADGFSIYLAADAATILSQPDLFRNRWQALPLTEQIDCLRCQQAYAKALATGRITPAKIEYLPSTPAPANPHRPPGSGPTRRLKSPRRLDLPQIEDYQGATAGNRGGGATPVERGGRAAAPANATVPTPDLFSSVGLATAAGAIPAGQKRKSNPQNQNKSLTPPTPLKMEKELANRIYNQLLQDLHTQIKNHPSPVAGGGTKQSIAAFAEAYNLSRQNLQKVFTLGTNSVSVGVYVRICVGLGIMPQDYLQGIDAREFDVSLRDYLSLNHNLLLSSIFAVRSAALPEAPAHV